MSLNYSISIYLDTRRAKLNNRFPVKLRVYNAISKVQKMYPTIFDFTEKEFESIWNTQKPRNEHKSKRAKLQAIEAKANEVAEKLKPFNFKQFEKKLYRKSGDGINISKLYKETILKLNSQGKIGTESSYDLSRKSFKKYNDYSTNTSFEKLTLYDITKDWLDGYEYYMTNVCNRSLTTVGIYLRTLRAIYNIAIDDKDIEKEFYPFGKRHYQIPTSVNKKKALNKEQLSLLFNSNPKIEQQIKAKDFWFFSYACNGLNIKDIALLKNKDIEEGKIEIYRAKTKLTSKAKLKLITIYLNDYSRSIIDKYGVKSNNPDDFVFNIISKKQTPMEQRKNIQNFTRSLNQHLKNLANTIGLPEDISSYWARHSFATNSIRQGASMEFMQESLGHKDLKTTMSYFAGFEDEAKKEFAEQLMNFE